MVLRGLAAAPILAFNPSEAVPPGPLRFSLVVLAGRCNGGSAFLQCLELPRAVAVPSVERTQGAFS
jgi:hypothetical protein